MTLAPTDQLVRDAVEAEARKVMARRAALKPRWDTRTERADLLAEAECLLDRWNELMARSCA